MHSIVSAETEQQMAELYAKGSSVAEIAAMTGVSYCVAYSHTALSQKINPETQKPFESICEYDHYRARQRQNQPRNQELSDLIPRELKRLGKNRAWLATELGISQGAVTRYASGEMIPRADLQERLLEILEQPYKTLGELVSEKEH